MWRPTGRSSWKSSSGKTASYALTRRPSAKRTQRNEKHFTSKNSIVKLALALTPFKIILIITLLYFKSVCHDRPQSNASSAGCTLVSKSLCILLLICLAIGLGCLYRLSSDRCCSAHCIFGSALSKKLALQPPRHL